MSTTLWLLQFERVEMTVVDNGCVGTHGGSTLLEDESDLQTTPTHSHTQSRDAPMVVVWRNVVLMSALHIAAVYALILIPSASAYTLLWSESIYLCLHCASSSSSFHRSHHTLQICYNPIIYSDLQRAFWRIWGRVSAVWSMATSIKLYCYFNLRHHHHHLWLLMSWHKTKSHCDRPVNNRGWW